MTLEGLWHTVALLNSVVNPELLISSTALIFKTALKRSKKVLV